MSQRKYASIWERLKSTHKAQIVASITLHPRIKKAVIKEKYNDLGFKLLCNEDNKEYKLIVISDKKVLAFKLIERKHILLDQL